MYDYTQILSEQNNFGDTWHDIYDESISVSENLISLLKSFLILPRDDYDIIAAYLMMPSALCKVVPYLFCCGRSGSGKTTLGKFASYWYGLPINTSSDTFASIRNGLQERKYKHIAIPSSNPSFPPMYKQVEVNTAMIWDDVDASVFVKQPDIYRLFKVGYDRSTDKISISSLETRGENIEFRAFCPKIFSSISPLYLDDAFKELRRRLIVVSFERVENIPDNRLQELGLTRKNYHHHLFDIDNFSWKGFNQVFTSFWNHDNANNFLLTRRDISKQAKSLGATNRAISLDLIATGIVAGIWSSSSVAIKRLKKYFDWYDNEVTQYGGISKYLKNYVLNEASNAVNAYQPIGINSKELSRQINIWLELGWILEKPKPKYLKVLMADLGLILNEGYWVKKT